MIDLSDFAAALRAPSLWDNPFLESLPAVSRYYQQKQDNLPPMQPTTSDVKIIMAGVQSCILANQVLSTQWGNPDSPEAKIATATALTVLKYWGIEIKDVTPEVVAASVPNPKPDVLVWPPVDREGRPLKMTLPDVYKENYYHVREQTVVLNNPAISGTTVTPDHQLTLREAYWNEEALQWRLQFSNASLPGQEPFWIDHGKVRVGDEIPTPGADPLEPAT